MNSGCGWILGLRIDGCKLFMSIVGVGNYEYSTDSLIGTGYSSSVYRGIDTNTNYPVVFKVIDTTSNTSIQAELLNNEVRALKIMDHPSVLETYNICRSGNHVFIICEYCEHGDVMKRILHRGAYSENRALDILTYLASGLKYIHALGIVHRDMKTSNIFLKADGTIRIGDFGFCEYSNERPTRPQRFNVGSPLYMSPEAYHHAQYSSKSDTWALGIIFYEMLFGPNPFKGMNYNVMVQNIENGYLVGNLEVSDYSKCILFGLLTIDPHLRWESSELMEVLSTRNAQYQHYNYSVEYPINPSFIESQREGCC